MSKMLRGSEWWRTVRCAIKKEGRTVRLIGVLVTVGAIMGALAMIGQGFTLTIG